MNSPLVSIVILNWNGKEHLQKCIGSVLKSLYSPLEILLTDNGSTDGSVEFVKSHFPSVIILENKENLGYAEGNNRGIGIAQGKYVVTLNNDTVVEKDWLDQPIEYLERDMHLGIVGCRQMNYFNRTLVDGLFLYPAPELIFKRFGHKTTFDPHGRFASPGYVLALSGGSAIYRKEMFTQLGGFDGYFFAYHDDADLCMRAFLDGWKCLYVPKSVVYHKDNASFKKRGAISHYFHERNRIWFIYKFFPWSFIFSHLHSIIFQEIVTVGLHFIKKNGRFNYFKARLHGFMGIRQYSKKRKTYTKKFLSRKAEFLMFQKEKIIPLS
jgi:hypothetical protein